ncbi:hypothetical protein B0F90DRAFT_1722372 [Multifurca ochricompacta]|uniref:SMODS and SLOG-associating 2TM effector domain-containing protein n=1 Tax=Multifurca ochricompacta TaxID=376703 RepID=A0AAD4M529_9AGAM|nr:hypothetical protein B0F90DRAFT_1722372 [Multifurca ochricompacta]
MSIGIHSSMTSTTSRVQRQAQAQMSNNPQQATVTVATTQPTLVVQSESETQTQPQQVLDVPTLRAPSQRVSYHEPHRRSLSPRAYEEQTSLALSGAENLGRISDSVHSLPPAPPPHSRSRARHLRSLGDDSYLVPDTSWIVPEEKETRQVRTAPERLQPTIDAATDERDKAAKRAKMTGYSINVAIGIQVVLGALTTGLGAALSGKSSSVAISVLGGASTIAASYLARTRGTNEPELSLLRAKSLNQFLREVHAFKLDHGHKVGHALDERIEGFRLGLEGMLGNPAGSVAIGEDMGSGPVGVGARGGAGMGKNGVMSVGMGAGGNAAAPGKGPDRGIDMVPQKQQQQQNQQQQYPGIDISHGLMESTFDRGAPPRNASTRANTPLGHSIV